MIFYTSTNSLPLSPALKAPGVPSAKAVAGNHTRMAAQIGGVGEIIGGEFDERRLRWN